MLPTCEHREWVVRNHEASNGGSRSELCLTHHARSGRLWNIQQFRS